MLKLRFSFSKSVKRQHHLNYRANNRLHMICIVYGARIAYFKTWFPDLTRTTFHGIIVQILGYVVKLFWDRSTDGFNLENGKFSMIIPKIKI